MPMCAGKTTERGEMHSVWTNLIEAMPVLALAVAIMMVPLLTDVSPDSSYQNKEH
jgi:hypothetical protein